MSVFRLYYACLSGKRRTRFARVPFRVLISRCVTRSNCRIPECESKHHWYSVDIFRRLTEPRSLRRPVRRILSSKKAVSLAKLNLSLNFSQRDVLSLNTASFNCSNVYKFYGRVTRKISIREIILPKYFTNFILAVLMTIKKNRAINKRLDQLMIRSSVGYDVFLGFF